MKQALKFLVALCVAIVILFAVRAYAFTIYTVPADLASVLRKGDRVLVNRMARDSFSRGDLDVFQPRCSRWAHSEFTWRHRRVARSHLCGPLCVLYALRLRRLPFLYRQFGCRKYGYSYSRTDGTYFKTVLFAMVSLLATTYFGPVQWYQKLNQSDRCLIERHDHFIKQTYRNRCVIATTNGLQALTVPIERFEGAHCAMLNIRISDHGSWRHLHWNALQSAYGESPFFEFYADDIRPFFERRWDFLVDFNMEITQKMCELLDIQPHITLTDAYV